MNDVREAVQAALLNSEGDPEEEVRAAVATLVEFALVNCEMTPEGLRQMVNEAIHDVGDG